MKSNNVDGSDGMEEKDNLLTQFRGWVKKTGEMEENRRIKRKERFQKVKTDVNEQITAMQGYFKKFGKQLGSLLSSGVDMTTNTLSTGVIVLSSNVETMISKSESFVKWLFLIPPDDNYGENQEITAPIGELTKFERYLDEAMQNIEFSEEKWCIFVSLIARRLEIILNTLLEGQLDDIEGHLDMFKLLKFAEMDNLLDSEQLDILHLFRKSRNDLLHGRTNEINSNLIIFAAHIVLDVENYASRDKIE